MIQSLLFVFSLVLFLGCGAPHPFQRGENVIQPKETISLPEASTEPQTPQLDMKFFEQNVLPALESKCARCHDNPTPDFASATRMVKLGNPDESDLFLIATGKMLRHRATFKEGTVELENLRTWILGAK